MTIVPTWRYSVFVETNLGDFLMTITEAEMKITGLITSTIKSAKAATISAWFLVYDVREPEDRVHTLSGKEYTAEEWAHYCEQEWSRLAHPIAFG